MDTEVRADPPFTDDRPVHFLAREYPAGHIVSAHSHSRAQLVHAVRGVLTVSLPGAGSWTVPPERGVWIPARTEHVVRCADDASMRTLYVAPSAAPGLPRASCVVAIPPLLRELILHLGRLQTGNDSPSGSERRAARVALDLMQTLEVQPLHLPRPRDPRLLRVVAALEADPGDRRSIEEWARIAAASARTLTRGFHRETGMSFGAWRQQLRLLRAIERLAAREPVTSVAMSVGYDSLSAFVRLFKRSFGVPPSRYFGPAAAERREA